MVDTPSGPPDIPTDEELEKMSLEQLQALQKQRAGPFTGTAPVQPGYFTNTPTQAVAGAKEGAANLLGTPSFLAKMGSAGALGMSGALGWGEEVPGAEQIQKFAQPYSTEAVLQGKSQWPGVGGLALTPGQQQPPQNFAEHLARSGAANLVGTAPLALAGPEAAMAAALRSVGGTVTGETAAKAMELAQTPEAAPWARAIGTFAGYGLPGGLPTGGWSSAGRQAQNARTAAANTLRGAGFPVSIAEERGSRLMAMGEQYPSDRSAVKELIDSKLNTRIPSQATGNPLNHDLSQAMLNAQSDGASGGQARAMANQIGELGKVTNKKGRIDADDYFRFSQRWGQSQNPRMNALAQVLDKHMADQNAVWGTHRPNLSNIRELGQLEKAQERVPFPEPFNPGHAIGAAAGAAAPIHYYMGGTVGPALEASALGLMLKAPELAQAPAQALSPLFRSAPGQAWMRGWPTNQAATYAALLAGPGQRLGKDIAQPQQ